MDPSTLHIILTTILGLLASSLGFMVKRNVTRMDELEKDLAAHKLEDTKNFAELHAHKDEVMRRLDSIDDKLDRLLQK